MKKNLKLMLTFALAGILVFSTTVMGHATDAKPVTPNSAIMDEAYLAEIEEFKAEVKSYVDSVRSTTKLGGHKTLSVPIKKQEKEWYCGPASVQMVLAYHGINKTQSHIAGQIGTIPAGSDIPPMTTYLNNQLTI